MFNKKKKKKFPVGSEGFDKMIVTLLALAKGVGVAF